MLPQSQRPTSLQVTSAVYRNVGRLRGGKLGGKHRWLEMPRGPAGPVKYAKLSDAVLSPAAVTDFQLRYARYAKLEKAGGHKPLPPKQWIAAGYPEPHQPKPTRADKIQRAIDTSDKRRRAKPSPPSSVKWPIHVTIGPHPTLEGALEVIELKSREHADALGYEWVGR